MKMPEILQMLARPYSVYVISTAMAIVILLNPSVDLLCVGAAVVTGQAAARTCDKIWGGRK